MNRAFISLYLILVLAIVLLGVVLNKFWEQVNPPVEIDPAAADLMLLIETQLPSLTGRDAQLPATSYYKINILDLQDFAASSTVRSLKSGGIVNASDDTANRYYKLTSASKVIELTAPLDQPHKTPRYFIFIGIFYSAIALVIFLWVWPLSRDLARLIKHTREVGAQGAPANINLSVGSLLAPFANAFNAMAVRLNNIMRSQKEMTYAVSHELRTPLARMKFALAMTENLQAEPGLLRQLESITRDVAEMENLINALLTYASFEQKAEPLEQREGHMEAMLCEMLTRLDNPFNIEIRIDNQAGVQTFRCEWALMQTALHNLLQNALGFAQQNIVVTMGVTEQFFWVSVEDDGPGVPEAQRDNIFESFVRLYGESDLNRHSGFGLGLAIVKRIMAWHRGSVSCTQAAQGGAKFLIQWP